MCVCKRIGLCVCVCTLGFLWGWIGVNQSWPEGKVVVAESKSRHAGVSKKWRLEKNISEDKKTSETSREREETWLDTRAKSFSGSSSIF